MTVEREKEITQLIDNFMMENPSGVFLSKYMPTAEIVKKIKTDPNMVSHELEIEGKLMGIIVAIIREEPIRMAEGLVFYVLPEYRGAGQGTILAIKHIKDLIDNKQVKMIALCSAKEHVPFWQRLGFVAQGSTIMINAPKEDCQCPG